MLTDKMYELKQGNKNGKVDVREQPFNQIEKSKEYKIRKI